MPRACPAPELDSAPKAGPEFIQHLEDFEFDQIFPDDVRNRSRVHWTPVSVARQAAQFLVTMPQTRVLDIGCGPGKFCAIGASATEGHFTGVEQRANLVQAGMEMIRTYGLQRVQLIHGNITEIPFANFDAFYLFNPFQENLLPSLRIDAEVETEPHLYDDYAGHVSRELARLPLCTRVVTYWGEGDEVPGCYECVGTACGGYMKMWIKVRDETLPSADAHAGGGMGQGYIAGGPFSVL